MSPLGWAVFAPDGGVALFLDRNRAEAQAVSIRGHVEPLFASADIAIALTEALLEGDAERFLREVRHL